MIPTAPQLFSKLGRWSEATFGDNTVKGPIGPLKHLIKEAGEAIEVPKDIFEYADCQILVWDAARRAGFSHEQLMTAVDLKADILATRVYPRTADGEVSEHIKEPNNA